MPTRRLGATAATTTMAPEPFVFSPVGVTVTREATFAEWEAAVQWTAQQPENRWWWGDLAVLGERYGERTMAIVARAYDQRLTMTIGG